MTQEEIMWCAAPELFATSLVLESMADNEADIIRGVRRISAHTGYLHTCRWDGFWRGTSVGEPVLGGPREVDEPYMDVLVMDAQVRQ